MLYNSQKLVVLLNSPSVRLFQVKKKLLKGKFKMRYKNFLVLMIAVAFFSLCYASFAADSEPPELRAWSHENNLKARDGTQEVIVRATYYSNEYIENLVNSEAEKNLWTQDEMENYKYTLLKNLNLSETIPVHVDFKVYGVPVYAQPFDKHIYMMIGKNKYVPSDYDRRFNFKMVGNRDGMVFFPRYDPKTGKNILEGAKDLRVVLDGSITQSGKGDVLWIWDLAKDRGKISSGKAASRLEVDRLLKRMDKLRSERAEIQKQLDAIDKEYGEVNSRIDEIQSE